VQRAKVKNIILTLLYVQPHYNWHGVTNMCLSQATSRRFCCNAVVRQTDNHVSNSFFFLIGQEHWHRFLQKKKEDWHSGTSVCMSKEASRKTLSHRSTVERQPNVSHLKKKLRTRTFLLTCLAPINLTLWHLRDFGSISNKNIFQELYWGIWGWPFLLHLFQITE